MKKNIEKWELSSGDLRANYDETNSDLADIFKTHIQLNVDAGKLTTYEIPPKLVAL